MSLELNNIRLRVHICTANFRYKYYIDIIIHSKLS